MKKVRWQAVSATFIVAVLCFFLPGMLQAQQGLNVVFGASGNEVVSPSYYDASVVTGASGTDLCSLINRVYALIPSGTPAVVIDSRGIPVGSGHRCVASPWANLTSPPPATILLPAGTIFLSGPGNTVQWILPNATRIVGEGRGTNIADAFTSVPSNPFMIVMGGAPFCTSCQGIVVQDVALIGSETSLKGIGGVDNESAGEFSYLDHVVVNAMNGTGLDGTAFKIGPGAANSGPYTNLNYAPAGNCSSTCTSNSGNNLASCATAICARINATTRGIHGMTCAADACLDSSNSWVTPLAAIELDANNNTIEDIHFEGFYDGIVIGDSASAASTTIINVNAGYGGDSGPVRNVVHICNGTASPSACSSTKGLAKDVAVMGVAVGGNFQNPLFHAYAIRDDVTGTILGDSTSSGLSGEASVGLYTLGEGAQGGNSRFTTGPLTSGSSSTDPSPNPAPVWATGSAPPTSSCPVGAIFSNTSGGGTATTTLYVCVGGSSGGTWNPITIQ